jgi:heme exporter protein A
MLEVTSLECVRGTRRLFKNVSFSLRPGDLVQLVGPNGSGKTSLLRMLCGLLPPTSGEIRWRGINIGALAEEFYVDVTYLGHRHGMKEELTAIENLCLSCGLSGHEVTREQTTHALARMGLDGKELPTRLLSEGQRRRLALARLLVSGTTLWLLDEVLTSLDLAAADLTRCVITEHLGKGGMAIVATHQELSLAKPFRRIELAS